MDQDVFDGNPLEYHNFITLFYELVEKRIDDPRGRLTQRVTQRIWYSISPSAGYENANKILEQNYGNRYNIIGVYRNHGYKSEMDMEKVIRRFTIFSWNVRVSPGQENGTPWWY